jgi:hypothetical protein
MNASAPVDSYRAFLEAKVQLAPMRGFDIPLEAISPLLKEHQKATVRWAVYGGCRAIFAAFGLGKTFMQLEIMRLILARIGGRGLIVAPLGVRQEFIRDAATLGIAVTFIRSSEQSSPVGLYLTNYESVREGKIDLRLFGCASLDEASVLRGFGGSKTFREFMRLFDGLSYKFVATATPSPNQYIELLAYAAFLEIMDVGQAKTRFFKRDSEKADQLTIHPHKEREFWLWVASWALFVQRPSDLGFSDEGYDLPPIEINWHEVPADHKAAGCEKSGQGRLFANAAIGVQDASRAKRDSLAARIDKMLELRAEDPSSHRLIWHDLEVERLAIEVALPNVVSVYGAQELEAREQSIIGFSEGRIQELAGKPVMMGSGCNFQRHCHWAIFLGIGFKFNDFIQAIHRIQRFLQTRKVRIDLIYSEAERDVRHALEAKWKRHGELLKKMSEIIREFGLTELSMAQVLTRSLGVERVEIKGETYRLVNNDCVDETRRMEGDSVDLIVTSIPFSTQYEYSPSYNDFGHTDDDAHFWAQMDFLTPELLRVLKPGRVAAIHVKDRITPGGMTGLGFQTVNPFSDDCVAHFRKHGFAFLARKTVVTDVVRENAQTYRLGWSEQCKDGTRMGAGMPEYVLLFRKAPTDRSNGYADVPVAKSKESYSRARWQLDAHGLTRSSGDRLLKPEDLDGKAADEIYKMFKRYCLENIYDFEFHVQIGEALAAKGRLPPTFMLIPPASWHEDVWTDITRMRTLNGSQAAKGKEMHLCPLQFDLVDRLILQCSQEGELIFDPFGGLMTVPYRAVKLRRRGAAVELNPGYFLDGAAYVEAAVRDMAMPSLFDLFEAPADAA